MRRLWLLLLPLALSAQNPNTPVFPTGVATDQDLLVAKNLASSTLTAAISATDTSIPVADGTKFTAPLVVAIDNEYIKVCSISGNTLTVCSGGRGFDGSTAAAHSSGAGVRGVHAAHHHNQIAAEIKAIESRLYDILHVKNFGAKGDGTTDDTTAFQNAINAVQGTQKTLRCDGGVYKTTATLTVTQYPFNLEGGGTCTIKPVVSSDVVYALKAGVGAGSTSTTLTASVNTGEFGRATGSQPKTLSVSSTTGFSAGDIILLAGTETIGSNTWNFSQLNEIQSIGSGTITFRDPVGITIKTTDANSVTKVFTKASGQGLSINGVTFDGTGLSGTAAGRGLFIEGAYGARITNITTKGWIAQNNSGAFMVKWCYQCIVSNYTSIGEGTDNEAALTSFETSNSSFNNLTFLSTNSFGAQFMKGVYLNVNNLSVSGGGAGRAIKLTMLGWSNFSNIHVHGAVSGYNGLAITGGSWRNQFTNVTANTNAAEGVWFSDQNNIYNVVSGVNAVGNLGAASVRAFASDKFNVVKDIGDSVTVSNAGPNNVFSTVWGTRTYITGCTAGTTTGAGNRFYGLPTNDCNTSANAGGFTLPTRALLRNLTVRVQNPDSGTTTFCGVFNVNTSSWIFSCTIGTGTSCTNTTDIVSVDAGVRIAPGCSTSGSGMGGITIGFEY